MHLKKKHFLLIAFAASILLHILVFIFAPELKSEINSNDYLKKITKISIFQEPESAPKQESAPKNPEITKSRKIKKSVPRNIASDSTPRNIDISESRNIDISESRNIDISESRNPDMSESRNIDMSESRNIDISESRNIDISESRNIDISESRNIDMSESRNIDISESRNPDMSESQNPESNSAPKTAGELAVIPKAKNPKTPDYPESLEDEGIEGSVTLELLISKEGKVLKAKVIKSDHELFSESALRTVKNYKFSPGKLKDGSEVDSLIEFVIKFEISL